MNYAAEQDCCTSFECPRYNECERALRTGQAHNYYTEGIGTSWASSSGEYGADIFCMCGEKGNWRLYLEHTPQKERIWTAEKIVEDLRNWDSNFYSDSETKFLMEKAADEIKKRL